MRQAIEIGTLSTCANRPAPWHARLRVRLFGHRAGRGLVAWDHRSTHLPRDIGLAEDARGNDLLRDSTFVRR